MSGQPDGARAQTVARARTELVIVLLIGLGIAVGFLIDVIGHERPRNVLLDVAGCVFVGGLWIYNVVHQVRKLHRAKAARS